MRILNSILGTQCPHCDSYSRLEEIDPGVYVLRVFHDDECHVLTEVP